MVRQDGTSIGKQIAGAVIIGFVVFVTLFFFVAASFLATLPIALAGGGIAIVVLLGGVQIGGETIGGLIDGALALTAEIVGVIFSTVFGIIGGIFAAIGEVFGGLN
ncbi:MAG: hypothetical protein GYB36_02600 [Alphaproteobacteria bacterium]|nr:hypothetical protein [Alphaproteobacteria bacterium]